MAISIRQRLLLVPQESKIVIPPEEEFRMCADRAPGTVNTDDALAALDDLQSVADVSEVLESL
ncbi:MmgE/PrpD family protein [Natrinema mahii]|nr:MmgE/PrpD family protein [Natrinema mahii]